MYYTWEKFPTRLKLNKLLLRLVRLLKSLINYCPIIYVSSTCPVNDTPRWRSDGRRYTSTENKKHDRLVACQGGTISSTRWIDDPPTTCCFIAMHASRITSFPDDQSSSSLSSSSNTSINVPFTFRLLTFPKRDAVHQQTFQIDDYS